MPNQLNYPERLVSTVSQRPSRISNRDVDLMRHAQKAILFGTSDRDVVELWVYYPDGSIANHVSISPTDTALAATTIVDQDGTHEVLNLDMSQIQRTLGLDPGRYVMVGNFFRNEVGAEDNYKLYISEISEDRTELRLTLVQKTDAALADMAEFLTPSVPRRYAQALMAEILGQSLDALPDEKVNQTSVLTELGSPIEARISYAGQMQTFQILLDSLLARTYSKALDFMASDVMNRYVQSLEIENYMNKGLLAALNELSNAGAIDPHFVLSD